MHLCIVLASIAFVSTNTLVRVHLIPYAALRERRNMRTRPYDIHLMLNEEEFRKLDSLSHASGLSFSALLRKLIMSETIRQRPNSDFRSLARAIDRIGNNINQLAHKANLIDAVSKEDATKAVTLMREVRREIADWKEKWQ